jgi:hypothetical protein
MAANKTLNVRVQNKYDTYANWTAQNPTPLSGEVCVVVVPASTGAVNQEPAVLIKVGDGTTAFKDLPFLSGTSADIYDWAKAATKPSYTADEISGLSDYINTTIEDTDTQYKIEQDSDDTHLLKFYSKGIGDAKWTLVSSITTADTVYDDTSVVNRVSALESLVGETAVSTQISNAISDLNLANTYDAKGAAADALSSAKTYADGKDADIQAAQDAADAAQGDVDALAETIGTVEEGKTVVEMISAAQTAATYDDTGVKADIKDNADAITKLNSAASVSGSVANSIENAIQALDASDSAVSGQFVTAVSEEDGVITVSRAALKASDIPTLETSKISGLDDALDSKQDTVAFEGAYDATNNKAATMSDVSKAVAGLSGAMHFQGTKSALPTDNSSYASGDVIIVGNKEYVFDGEDWKELGDETIYAVKGNIVDADISSDTAIAQSKIAGLTDALAAKANASALGTMAAKSADDYLTSQEVSDNYVAKNGTDRLITTTEATKLNNIEEKAQVNVIETVKVNGTALTPDANKAVNVAVPTGKLASKDTVGESDLDSDLQSTISAKANSSDLAAVATTGNVADLEQTSGTYVVFNCGSASENI